MKRFLFACGRPAFPFFIGGDGTIAHTMLSELTRIGVDCRSIGTFGDHVVNKLGRLAEYRRDGEFLHYRAPYPVALATEEKFIGLVETTIGEFAPDVVFAQLEWAREILELAKRNGCATALYILDLEHAENFRGLKSEPDLVFAVSDFMRRELRTRLGIESRVLYPFVNLDGYRTDRTGDCLTMVNPVPVKGVEIGLELAERLPQHQFLFVEGWGTDPAVVARIEGLPNTTYLQKQIDMRPVYGRTRVLLVPSQWQEAFGRVVVEAQASGIPVIASRTGGLPEAVGAGGILIDDYRNPDCWLAAVQDLLEDPEGYANLSAKAIENTGRFQLQDELDGFIRSITALRSTFPSSDRGIESAK